MAVVDLSKVMNLADAQEIYKDLRDRLKTVYTKPDTGIPASDLAPGVIPVEGLMINNLIMPIDANKYIKLNVQNGIQLAMDGLGTSFWLEAKVSDVRIGDTSIVSNNVATIPMATSDDPGIVKVSSSNGVYLNNGVLTIDMASDARLKDGESSYKPIVPFNQHKSIYYGLSKLAGADLKNITCTVGTYPDASKQAIQKLLGLDGLFGTYQTGITASKAYAVGETFIMDGKRYKVTAAISDGGLITVGTNCELCPVSLSDIQANGTSILNNGIANIPPARLNVYGVVTTNSDYGISSGSGNNLGRLQIVQPTEQQIKEASSQYRPITPSIQHGAAFYGLAKAAGDTTQAQSVNAVGTYTPDAKTAIQSMLGVSTGAILIENVSGGTPALTCMPNVRYKCGEVGTLSITPPASGSCEVIFTSGSTPTVLTVPNTVKFPAWFDYTDLEANTIYDIIITDGVYGAVMSWAS